MGELETIILYTSTDITLAWHMEVEIRRSQRPTNEQ
jgi:hypothetical protein